MSASRSTPQVETRHVGALQRHQNKSKRTHLVKTQSNVKCETKWWSFSLRCLAFCLFCICFLKSQPVFALSGSSYNRLQLRNEYLICAFSMPLSVSREPTLKSDGNINVIKCCFTVLLLPLAQVGNLNPNQVLKWPTTPITINNSYIKVITECKCSEWLMQDNC